jgi:hypothetical protein
MSVRICESTCVCVFVSAMHAISCIRCYHHHRRHPHQHFQCAQLQAASEARQDVIQAARCANQHVAATAAQQCHISSRVSVA